MKTPTIEPAVPGAKGANPAPPAVATTTATQSVFVFTISVGSVNFFGRPFLGGYPIVAAGPFAQIDQLATFTAKRPVRIAGVFGFFVTRRAFHGVFCGRPNLGMCMNMCMCVFLSPPCEEGRPRRSKDVSLPPEIG